MSRFLSVLILSAVVMAPISVRAHEQSYFAAESDKHVWNQQEQRAWERFLEEKKIAYHDWSKASSREQKEYWAWRHDHPD
jgi:hypothetical protein